MRSLNRISSLGICGVGMHASVGHFPDRISKGDVLVPSLFLSASPEMRFAKDLLGVHADLFDSAIKSPNRGFYQFPYSYKPTDKGSSHVKLKNFNPDFLIKLKDNQQIFVVEIKDDSDSSPKNRAKYRDGKTHFHQLNATLAANGIDWIYHFYLLSPEDFSPFFQALRNQNWAWKSQLMQQHEASQVLSAD